MTVLSTTSWHRTDKVFSNTTTDFISCFEDTDFIPCFEDTDFIPCFEDNSFQFLNTVGHAITVMFLLSNQDFVILLVWQVAPSCWKRKFLPQTDKAFVHPF